MATSDSLRQRVIGLTEPLLEQLGFELVDVEWGPAQGGGVLRFYIDRAAGRAGGHIGIEDCERASRELSALLDVEDPVPGAYSLEVSSPGFDRVLRKPAHFGRFVGSKVRVELAVARDGRRRYSGRLAAVAEDAIEMEVEGEVVKLRFAEIAKARVVA
jgi:ribosome maturation factor RimP